MTRRDRGSASIQRPQVVKLRRGEHHNLSTRTHENARFNVLQSAMYFPRRSHELAMRPIEVAPSSLDVWRNVEHVLPLKNLRPRVDLELELVQFRGFHS